MIHGTLAVQPHPEAYPPIQVKHLKELNKEDFIIVPLILNLTEQQYECLKNKANEQDKTVEELIIMVMSNYWNIGE